MKGLKKTMGFMTALLGLSSIPIKNGKTDFSEEQKTKLTEKLGEDLTRKSIEAIDKEATRILQEENTNTELSEIRQELSAALEDTNMSEEDAVAAAQSANQSGEGANGSDESLAAEVRNLTSQLISHQKKQDKMIQKLINEPEGDSPDAEGKVKTNGKVKHSDTHLFASGKAYDSYEGRPWNQHAADGKTQKRTNWMSSSGVEVQKLNGDLDLYFRENPDAIRSLHRDNFGLPSFWPKRTKVDDQVTSASIVSAEITQARKLPWLPKNKQAIKPETGKIFPIQVDIEFVGKWLQDLESSWLNKFVGEGSSPYKTSFVQFLVNELDKRARTEDRQATINGIYVETPDDATVGGKAMNRQDGLLIQIYRAYYMDKKFKSANIGAPTKQNILDYVVDMIENNLKEEVKNNNNLVFYWSKSWERAYKSRYRQVHGLETDFDGDVLKVENYPNIDFVALPDLEGSNFMFITFEDNIEILENLPQEKSLYRFEYLKRMIYVLGDYKLGVRMIHIGNKVKDTDPDAFKVQTVWTNGLPMFKDDTFVPVYDDGTGELEIPYKNVMVQPGFNTDITAIKGTYAGQVIKIRGNTGMASAKKVKKSEIPGLASDFNLQSGGTLTLYVDADLKLKEIKRTTTPPVAPVADATFDADVIDATDGSVQTFVGGSATTVTEVVNGVEGQELTIKVDAAAAALTISDVAGNVEVASDAVFNSDDDTLTLVYIDGVWQEVSRAITV